MNCTLVTSLCSSRTFFTGVLELSLSRSHFWCVCLSCFTWNSLDLYHLLSFCCCSFFFFNYSDTHIFLVNTKPLKFSSTDINFSDFTFTAVHTHFTCSKSAIHFKFNHSHRIQLQNRIEGPTQTQTRTHTKANFFAFWDHNRLGVVTSICIKFFSFSLRAVVLKYGHIVAVNSQICHTLFFEGETFN